MFSWFLRHNLIRYCWNHWLKWALYNDWSLKTGKWFLVKDLFWTHSYRVWGLAWA